MAQFAPSGGGTPPSGSSTTIIEGKKNPVITVLPMPVAGTEYFFALPVGLINYLVVLREDKTTLRVSYIATGTSTNYITVRPSCFYTEENVDNTNIVLHVRADKPANLEILTWV